MRTAHKVLAGAICVCALPYAGYRIHALIAPEPVLLACPDVTAIPETREVHTASLLPAWPVPPEATPIPAPRRAVRRSKPALITNAPATAVQCAPDQLSRAPGDGDGAAPNEVPEPSSASVALAGLAGLVWMRRKKGKPCPK